MHSNCFISVSKDIFHSEKIKTRKNMWFIQLVIHTKRKTDLGFHEMIGKWIYICTFDLRSTCLKFGYNFNQLNFWLISQSKMKNK